MEIVCVLGLLMPGMPGWRWRRPWSWIRIIMRRGACWPGCYLFQGLKDKSIEQYEVLLEMEPGVEMVRMKLELLKRG